MEKKKKKVSAMTAHIKGFPQANEILLRGKIKKGLPMEKTIFLNGIEVPELKSPGHPHEPWAFEAREFVRCAYNTKQIRFFIEHKKGKTPFCRAEVEGQDIAEQLLVNNKPVPYMVF